MNNSNISEKDQKKLFKALDKMKVQQVEEKKKSFEKLFKKFDGEPSLNQSLNSFTVAELKEIKRIWNVAVNSTAKKGELVEKIEETIQENILRGIEYFDSERIGEYKKLINVDVESKYFNGMNSAIYFRKIGLLFPGIIDGNKKIYCPVEIKSAIDEAITKKEFKNMIEKNDSILNLLRGYLHVYGVLNISRFITLIKENLGFEVEYDWFIQLMLQRYSFKSNEYTICGECICHEDVFDHMGLLEETEKLEYEYKVYPSDKLISFGKYDFGEDSEQRRVMKDLLLKAYTMEECDAEEIVAACEYAMRNNKELSFIMEYLGHNLVINDSDIYSKILKALVDLKEDTIHWSLKGHTPKTLEALDSKKIKVKVGRNDPCICGSGKKYKKCCGKN